MAVKGRETAAQPTPAVVANVGTRILGKYFKKGNI